MMEGVLAAVAAGRRLEIAEDVRRGIARKAQVGGTPYRAPIGYVNVSKIHDGREVRDVALDPVRAPLIRELFELYASESYSQLELAAIMEVRGLRSRPTPKTPAQVLTPNRLSSILRNEYYLGKVTINGKPFEGRHEALVSLETFQTVQRILESRRQNGARAWKHHHYLAGSLFCGQCSGRLLYSRNRGKSGTVHEYFVCIGKTTGSCQQPYHRLHDIEDAVHEHYATVSLTPNERQDLGSRLRAQLEELSGVSQEQLTTSERSLGEVTAKQRKLLEAFYADSIGPDLFHREQKQLRDEQAACERVIESLQADLEAVEANVVMALDLLVAPDDAYERAAGAQRNLMNQGYFAALYVDQGEVVGSEVDPLFSDLLALQSQRLRDKRENAAPRRSAGLNQNDPRPFSGSGVPKSDRWYPRRDSNPRPAE
ncbi:MAG: recombinase family protein [Thermoleophilaceae bacterium]|nr:recombinase family protein [Thermoleophilaceae bacterium]